jgi:hypothetical protein
MVVFVPVPVVDTNRTGSGMKTLGSGRARDLYIGLGLFEPGSLFTKIRLRLGLLLNKQKSQARGPIPKPKPVYAWAIGLFIKSPTQA